MWAEENGKGAPTTTNSSGELRGVGVSQAGIESDATALGDAVPPPGMPDATGAPAPGAPAPAAPATPPAA